LLIGISTFFEVSIFLPSCAPGIALAYSDGESTEPLKPPETSPVTHWHVPFRPKPPELHVPCELQSAGCPVSEPRSAWPYLLAGAVLFGAGYLAVSALRRPRYGRSVTAEEGQQIAQMAKELSETTYKNATNKLGARIDLTNGLFSDCTNYVQDVLIHCNFRLDWSTHGDIVTLSPRALEPVAGGPRPGDIVVQWQGKFKHVGILLDKVANGIYRAFQIGDHDLVRTLEPGHLTTWGSPGSHTIFNKAPLEFYRIKIELLDKATSSI
jgi:hypothetical protein